MRTSAAALELDFTEPSITAAKAVACSIAQNGSLQRDTLLWVMEQCDVGITTAASSPCRPAGELRSTNRPLIISTRTTARAVTEKAAPKSTPQQPSFNLATNAGRMRQRGRVSEPPRVAGRGTVTLPSE